MESQRVQQDLPTEQQPHDKNSSSRIFMVLDFASSSLTYFALILVYSVKYC